MRHDTLIYSAVAIWPAGECGEIEGGVLKAGEEHWGRKGRRGGPGLGW